MGLYPIGYDYCAFDVPKSVLSKVGPELRRLLDDKKGVEKQPNGRYLILGEQHETYMDTLYKPNRFWLGIAHFFRMFVNMFKAVKRPFAKEAHSG